MRVTLVATHVTGAPIHEISSRMTGNYFEVEGEVLFTPLADTRYRVRGSLAPAGSSVWIEDAETRQKVTVPVSSTGRE